jgi:type IX secretion system PorP/SprF family membrane protein
MNRTSKQINYLGMKGLLTIIIIIVAACEVYAQDPQFSQFYAAPLYLGPSMAGTANNPRVGLNFRDQWPKLTGRFITYALSFDSYLSEYNSGVGLLFLRDNAGGGKLTTTQAGLNYSYRLKLNRNVSIQPGLQFLYYQRKINFDKLTFADQFFGDEILNGTVESPPDDQSGHIDFSGSLLAFSKNMWLGSSVDHLMRMSTTLQSDVRYVPLKLSVYGGIKFLLKRPFLNSDEESISFTFHYMNQALMQQLDMGIYYNKLPFMVGLWYRGIPIIQSTKTKDAISICGGIMIKQLTFTYSYDLTISSLISSTGGAHEISLIYVFDQTQGARKRKMETVPCPRF